MNSERDADRMSYFVEVTMLIFGGFLAIVGLILASMTEGGAWFPILVVAIGSSGGALILQWLRTRGRS